MAREFFKNLPDTTTPLNAQRMNAFLNGLEAMGSIVVDDIECKNKINVTLNSITKNGVTITKNKDNSLTLNGTCTEAFDITLNSDDLFELLAGEKYALSFTNNSGIYFRLRTATSGGNSINIDAPKTSNVFTCSATGEYYVYMAITANTTFNNLTIYPQIEKGDKVTEYTPHKKITYTIPKLFKEMLGMPAKTIGSSTNLDDLYKEAGIKFYTVWGNKPISSPSGAYEYALVIVITNDVDYLDRWTNIQIYISDGVYQSERETRKAIYIRNGTQNWCRYIGSEVAKTTS